MSAYWDEDRSKQHGLHNIEHLNTSGKDLELDSGSRGTRHSEACKLLDRVDLLGRTPKPRALMQQPVVIPVIEIGLAMIEELQSL